MRLKRKYLIATILTLITIVILFITTLSEKMYAPVKERYQVFLNGDAIGVIEDKDKLYQLIDNNQSVIKNNYGVNNVYPPTNLKIIEMNTYTDKTDSIADVYKKIEAADNFTIKGYVVTVKGEEHNYTLNIIDKELFYEAAKNLVKAFIEADSYNKYINNIQDEIEGTGTIIEGMYFKENITIKEAYLSVDEKIYTDSVSLSQFLLFGNNAETKYHTVKLGDTIDSVAEENKLNAQEFLIANPSYRNENVILRVGDKVNVTLIDPQITYVYNVYTVKDEEINYEKKVVVDKTKNYGYNEITTRGQVGITRVTEKYTVTNGTPAQDVDVISYTVLSEPIDQVTTKGPSYQIGGGTGTYIDDGGDWGWPTNKPYTITSQFGYRHGSLHKGLDISGTGFGSKIYAANVGTVIEIYTACPNRGSGYGDQCGGSYGNHVLIDHGNGYYTLYAHLISNVPVRVGQTVSRGQVIGYMGSSGSSTGAHLHFSISTQAKGNYINPLSFYR